MSNEKDRAINRLPITDETKEWSPRLDTQPPISPDDIPGFVAWVDYNGFFPFPEESDSHEGADFAAFVTEKEVILGLPGRTPVRAVADGVVHKIELSYKSESGDHYQSAVFVLHGKHLISGYRHIVPGADLKVGGQIKKGQLIGGLYKDEVEKPRGGRLVHLHFTIRRNFEPGETPHEDIAYPYRYYQDPIANIIPEMGKHKARPMAKIKFTVDGFEKLPVRIAHFKKLRIWGG